MTVIFEIWHDPDLGIDLFRMLEQHAGMRSCCVHETERPFPKIRIFLLERMLRLFDEIHRRPQAGERRLA